MRFVVPQFIDIEPKIIGPITPRQFIIIIIGGGLTFLCYKLFSFWVFIIATFLFIVPVFGAFAFVKFNGRPFHYFILSIIQSVKRPSLRIWRKEYIPEKEAVLPKDKKISEPIVTRKPLPAGRLSTLSLQVDTGGKFVEEE